MSKKSHGLSALTRSEYDSSFLDVSLCLLSTTLSHGNVSIVKMFVLGPIHFQIHTAPKDALLLTFKKGCGVVSMSLVNDIVS